MKALRVALVAIAVSTVTSTAFAQASEASTPGAPARALAPTFRHRAMLGLSLVFPFSHSTELNGESDSQGPEGDASEINVSFDFGLEERFTRLFSLAARARRSSWNYGWASTVGYDRQRWDLGLEPRLWFRPVIPSARDFVVEFYVGAGSGVTYIDETPPTRRAYEERIEGSPGYHLSACIGIAFGWQHFTWYVETGYWFHSMHAEATFEPRAPGALRTVEDRDYLEHALLLSAGMAFGFGELK